MFTFDLGLELPQDEAAAQLTVFFPEHPVFFNLNFCVESIWGPGQDDPYDPYLVKDVKMENHPAPEVPVPDLQSLIPKLLRFLHRPSVASVADAASSTLVAASRRLWRLGALEPQGYGLPPKLTPLGGESGNPS